MRPRRRKTSRGHPTRAGSPQPLIEAASARSCRQPPPTRQRSGHYHAATLWETPPNWQLPRQIAGSLGIAGRAGAGFSRAEPCVRSSEPGWLVAGWALYEAAAAL